MSNRSIEHVCSQCGHVDRVRWPSRAKTLRQISVSRAPSAESPNRFQVVQAAATFDVADGEVSQIGLKEEMLAIAIGSALPAIAIGGAVGYGVLSVTDSLPLTVSAGTVAGMLTFKPLWWYGVNLCYHWHSTLSGWIKQIDLSGEFTLWQGGEPDPPKPPETPLQMVVRHEADNKRPWFEVIDVPLNGADKAANLRRWNDLAIGLLQGRPFTYAEWTGGGKLLSRNEYDKAVAVWQSSGILSVNPDGTKTLTRQGRHTLRGMLKMQGIEVEDLIDGERGTADALP